MLNHITLTLYDLSHLYHSLLPVLTLYPYSQTLLFITVFLSTRMDSARCNFFKVHIFRKSHIKTFCMVEVGLSNNEFQNLFQENFSLSWRIACPNIWSSFKPIIGKWPGLACMCPWRTFHAEITCPCRIKSKTVASYINASASNDTGPWSEPY